jgi:Na+/melibiose symporter-like transporter
MKNNQPVQELTIRDKIENQNEVYDYGKSRRYFIYEGCMAVGITSLSSGAYLAGLASYLGATDGFNGIIAAIPAATGIVQLLSSMTFEHRQRRKPLILLGSIIFRLSLSVMFFVPSLFPFNQYSLILIGALYTIAYLLSSFINPAASNWLVELTPENMRGEYFARRDSISLGFLTVLSVLMGMVVDHFQAKQQEQTGFVLLGGILLVMTLADVFFLGRIREPHQERLVGRLNLKDIIVKPLRNVNYRKVIVLFLLWNMGIQIGGPFFSIYMVTGLKLNYTYIMLLGVLTSFVRVFAAPYWGRLVHKKSWDFTAKTSIALLAIAHLGWLFINADTVMFFMPVLNILGGIGWSGVNLSLFYIPFAMAPQEGKTMYIGMSSALGGIAGFFSTLIGAAIVNAFDGMRINVAGLNFTNMHIVFVLSGIIMLLAACYIQSWRKKTI